MIRARLALAVSLAVAFLLAGCATPSVNLGTPEPIKVDISMRLDVYQYTATKAGSGTGSQQQAANDPQSRRRNRMADIQDFKNNRLVGEGHEGLLIIVEMPEGDFGEYVRKTVDAENADRMEQMKKDSEEKKLPLSTIQAERADLWRSRAFKGEWIEVAQPDGSWKKVQKEG